MARATAALDQVIAAGRYAPDVITCIDRPAEQLSELRGQQFDLIVSNAVLEHVFDLARVARSLADLTRPGGINSHQVDFGDHLDRDSPLEFLTRSNTRFYLERLRHPSQGNRLRQSECIAIFKGAGFDIDTPEPSAFAEDGYMQEFLPRLRQSKSRYRDWAAADLRVLGTRLYLRR
jgi:SAM-dependent methyltransferase